ncbi:hypothetical protein D3C84_665990 [compost metagenome]
MIRIMGCPYSVDIVLFHKQNIRNHAFLVHGTTAILIELMAIHAFEGDDLAVDFHQTIFDFKLAETNLAALCL